MKLKKNEEGKLFSRVEDLQQEFNNLSEKPDSPGRPTDSKSFEDIQSMRGEFVKLKKCVQIQSGNVMTTVPSTSRITTATTKRNFNSEKNKKSETSVSETFQRSNYPSSMTTATSTNDSTNERFVTILETFNSVGEILLLSEKIVITNPLDFCKVLVDYAINHEILNQEENNVEHLEDLERLLHEEDQTDPEARTKLLPRGFFFKRFAEDDEGEKNAYNTNTRTVL